MAAGEQIPEATRMLTDCVIGRALAVHKALGPGLLESVYETCLAHELRKAGLEIERQFPVRVHYDGLDLDAALKIDLLVQRRLVLEIKAVESLLPIHSAQLLTYLRLSGCRLGLLMNFNVIRLKDGIRRLAL
jgi:GxxExxY protein